MATKLEFFLEVRNKLGRALVGGELARIMECINGGKTVDQTIDALRRPYRKTKKPNAR